MSERMTCEVARESFGVLVLGAIDPLERDAIERHIFSCSNCAADLAEISSLPGLLKRLDGDRMATDPPPPQVLDRIIKQVRAEAETRRSRSQQWRRAGAALLAVAAVAAVVLGISISRNATTPATIADPVVASSAAPTGPASATNHETGVTATIALSPAPIGTELDVSVNGVNAGEHCEIIVVNLDGTREVAASWVAGYVGAAQVTGTTGFAADEIARVEISTPEGQQLVTVPINEAAQPTAA